MKSTRPIRLLALLATLLLAPLLVLTLPACRTTGIVQSGNHSAKAISFMSMKDSWELVKGFHQAFAAECARGNAKALQNQQEIDAKYDDFRAKLDAAVALLGGNWEATTPEEQAKLAADVIRLISALGIIPRQQ